MFNVTKGMLSRWAKDNEPKATSHDIAMIEKAVGGKLHKAYIDFVKDFGFVIFGRDPEERQYFDFIHTYSDRKEYREGNISYFKNPNKVIESFKLLTDPNVTEDEKEEFPKFPTNYIPIGKDLGHGEILLELGEDAGRILYWPFSIWAWGMGDNNKPLGFIAQDLYDFINSLRPADR